ncbi:MAG TPA: nucleotide exchange factor GrpE, partial [Candidatus Limnocylindrales bacterium]|nr:nucleotide exchange factor GrpE [Candidatus Limnocylindrales bacterium]
MVKKKNIEQNNKQVHERMEPIPEAGKVSTEETEVTAAFEESKIECEELSEFEIASLQWLQEKEELMDRLKRKQAEMDNLRRISKMEQAEAREYALSEFLCRLLPVLDNLERALEAARGSKEVSDAH